MSWLVLALVFAFFFALDIKHRRDLKRKKARKGSFSFNTLFLMVEASVFLGALAKWINWIMR